MSRETMEWLNTNTLIGFTEKRGSAWHARQGYDNHYLGAVPVEDVRKRLFAWTAQERPIFLPEMVEAEGGGYTGTGEFEHIEGRKAIVRSDTGAVLGIFGDGYQPHQYDEWLVKNVETILDDDLQIGTAGLLRGGGQAWVQVEVPETIEGPAGIRFRPFLLAATSLDGSLSTTYGRAITNTVCDNTMAIAMGEHGGERFKVRHSSKSLGKISDARDALGIVYSAADDFTAQVNELLSHSVSDAQFSKFLDGEVLMPEDRKKAPGAAKVAAEKREYIFDLYRFDERVAPWSGNAFGAWQAFNTYSQHESKLNKGTVRAERNAGRMVKGDQDKADFGLLTRLLELTS